MNKLTNGGPAFPGSSYNDGDLNQTDEFGSLLAPGTAATYAGMTLRDYFATNAPTDEVQELIFRHLSPDAQELLTGMKRPTDSGTSVHAERMAFQLAEFDFKCAVNAAIRFKLADAMLKARTA